LHDISILSDFFLRSKRQAVVNNISILRELVTHEHEETTAKKRGQLDISRLPLSFSFNKLNSCNRW